VSTSSETGIEAVRASPADNGRLELIARRPAVDARELLDEATLDADGGLVGDNWATKPSLATGAPDPRAQLTLMNARSAALVAGEDRERWALAGDQLYVDLDLSYRNLPPGTRLRIGEEAVVEVTDEPHHGCGKFSKRFGVDALKLVNSAVGRELNMRGINTRVVAGGVVRVGDQVVKAEPEAGAPDA
jgi:MOSC domain-containing protein YiiM